MVVVAPPEQDTLHIRPVGHGTLLPPPVPVVPPPLPPVPPLPPPVPPAPPPLLAATQCPSAAHIIPAPQLFAVQGAMQVPLEEHSCPPVQSPSPPQEPEGMQAPLVPHFSPASQPLVQLGAQWPMGKQTEPWAQGDDAEQVVGPPH
jgi:hypothetical protein